MFQLSNAAKRLDPNFLKYVESTVLTARQTHGVVEKRPLHDRDQVF